MSIGSYQASAAQAAARSAWMAALHGADGAGACDQWHMDDGHLVIRPDMLDPWLREFDAAIVTYAKSS